ncbi:hypothetical protein F5Y04DRAFT_291076 [Hypomontagnella monticulosa]|nr:hypothetical protein F5Y04DRAFT_291076 [Hypomontagnella monticulosa]
MKDASSPEIRTQDSIPVRKAYDRDSRNKFEDMYPNWPEVQAACFEFIRKLNLDSKLVILVGEKNFREMRQLVATNEHSETVPLFFNHDAFPYLFNQPPAVYLVRNTETKAVQKVVFASNHGQAFYVNPDQRIAAYHDLLWNAVLDFSSIPIDKEFGFLKLVAKVTRGTPRSRVRGALSAMMGLRTQEKASGANFKASFLRSNFPRVPEDVFAEEPESGSYIKAILAQWAKKSNDPYEMVRKLARGAMEKGEAVIGDEEWLALANYRQHAFDLAKDQHSSLSVIFYCQCARYLPNETVATISSGLGQ